MQQGKPGSEMSDQQTNQDTASPETSEQSDSHSSYVIVEETSPPQVNGQVQETPPLEVEQTAEHASEQAELNAEQSKSYCSFFQQGKCRFGDSCFNLHESDPDYKPPKQQRHKNRKQKKKSASDEEGTCSKCRKQKKKLRTVMDVVHRIQWDDKYNPEDFIVGFLDRFDGLVEEGFQYFDWSDVTTVDDWESFCIPKHRVYYFKHHGEIVWDRRTRTDNIFSEREIKCDQCEKT